jgi:hypothetical protein
MENLLLPKFERFFDKLKYSEDTAPNSKKTSNLIKSAQAAAKVIEKEDANSLHNPVRRRNQ